MICFVAFGREGLDDGIVLDGSICLMMLFVQIYVLLYFQNSIYIHIYQYKLCIIIVYIYILFRVL